MDKQVEGFLFEWIEETVRQLKEINYQLSKISELLDDISGLV